MSWYAIDTWIVVIGALAALSCALLGNWLVLRRMSMMGDAMSHAVLPGLAIAFLLTGSRASVPMFIGAAVVGVITAAFIQWVQTFGRVDRGAAMGVVFTTFFAVGLILIVRAADHVDLDPGCVLYGAIELAPMDVTAIAGVEIPRAVVVLGAVLLVNALLVGLFYKELTITSFDPELATTLGINASAMHYLLMTLVAVTTVASFEAIGSILVVAMLVVPAAAAHLLTDRLGPMIAVSLVFAVLSAALGHVAAIELPKLVGFEDTITSGMIATVAGMLFVIVALFAPRHGVISKAVHRVRLSQSILAEDALGLLYRLEEHGAAAHAASFIERFRRAVGARPLAARLALRSLARRGLVQRTAAEFAMTAAGRERAMGLVRSHRLWEAYLLKHLALPPDHVHATAMRLEHITGAEMQRELAEQVEDAREDPHGRKIPPAG